MEKIEIEEIIKFLRSKKIKYKLDGKDGLVLKHCLLASHPQDWVTFIWYEPDQNKWIYFCKNPNEDPNGMTAMYDVTTIEEILDFYKNHEIDPARSINKKK